MSDAATPDPRDILRRLIRLHNGQRLWSGTREGFMDRYSEEGAIDRAVVLLVGPIAVPRLDGGQTPFFHCCPSSVICLPNGFAARARVGSTWACQMCGMAFVLTDPPT